LNTPRPVDADVSYDLGPYRLLGTVRHGDFVVTCRAVHRQLGQHRVVKVLLPGTVPGAVARRFVREARLLSDLRHPALPDTFEAGRLPSGGAFVAMEPVQGEPVDRWLRRAGSLERRPAVAAAIIATVADACAHLARRGLVHGDLRSGNLLVLPDEASSDRFTMTLIGSEEAALRWRPGTPLPDVRSDIFSLGCVFLELLTGEAPSADDPSQLAPMVPGVAVEMRRLMGRMLARSPEDRYQSMDEIVTAIELMLGRHRSRFAELLTSPEAPVDTRGTQETSSDLTTLRSALTGEAWEEWIAGTVGRVRGLGAASRDAIIRRLAPLWRRPTKEPSAVPTILVAEDDDDTRESIVELLRDHGYRVIAARHGREAQEYLLKGAPAECMLMDLWMPEMDGWTLAAEMREGRVPAVPTIVMTAAEPHWGYPCSMVVRKPVDSQHLLGLVRTISGNGAETPAAI
jgi:hypothetical protein